MREDKKVMWEVVSGAKKEALREERLVRRAVEQDARRVVKESVIRRGEADRLARGEAESFGKGLAKTSKKDRKPKHNMSHPPVDDRVNE